jgi:hypothetical protein
MALVALAHLHVTLTRRDIKQEIPELTLDMALEVLRSAFARSALSEDEASDLIDYHLGPNRTAHDSHRKTWLKPPSTERRAVERRPAEKGGAGKFPGNVATD